VQVLLDRQEAGELLALEIRARVARPPMREDLHRLSISLLERSRLLVLRGVADLKAAQAAALFDPLLETLESSDDEPSPCLDVFCRPGVTDAEGEAAAEALALTGLDSVSCHAGVRYRFAAAVTYELRESVEKMLGNPLIHTFYWDGQPLSSSELDAGGEAVPEARSIEIRFLASPWLRALSREHDLALDDIEMKAIQSYFEKLGRAPSDVELQSIALTWSEHCSHKTFKSTIQLEHDGRIETVYGLLHSCIAEPTQRLARPWVRSAFVDNAGIIAFDAGHDLAFKVETHNHPTALEPFGGAHTGVGGVIRDILAVSGEPIANTDVLCFGPPDLRQDQVPPGTFHPAHTYKEVVRGVGDYGNNMGIPTVGGGLFFHPDFTANPLVFCGTAGILPHGSHPCDPRPGDAIVLLGGRTGRDGLHGATMSSATLERETVAASTVQIGSPIVEKKLRDVIPVLRDARLYHAITDCGAGGLCSAAGEMGSELGLEIDLALVPLKYQGLAPWEIWLSEAQERMVLAVDRQNVPRLVELCAAHEVEASVLGIFRDDGLVKLRCGEAVVAELEMEFMHNGRPARTLTARWSTPARAPHRPDAARQAEAWLLRLLAHPNIAGKEDVIRRYDHEVGGATVLKPLIGKSGPSDAAVLKPLPDSWRGAVIAHGMNPLATEIDPYEMAFLAVDEALRNVVAAGGSIDRVALLDNFCWGDVDDPEVLGSLSRAAQGCRDAALRYRTPFICGKDSLRNTSVNGDHKLSIPGTLLVSAIGTVSDIRHCISMDLKASGSSIYIVGATDAEMGGSHLLSLLELDEGGVSKTRQETPRVMRRLSRAIRRGLVLSCHDLSEGGLAVAAAEMAIAGGRGLELDVDPMPSNTSSPEALLFGETPGRFLVEVPLGRHRKFERTMRGLPVGRIGAVLQGEVLRIRGSGRFLVKLPLERIERAWRGTHALPGASPSPFTETLCNFGRGELRSPAPPQGASQHGAFPTRFDTGATAKPKVLVLTAPGTNCDRETIDACRLAGCEPHAVLLNQLLSGTQRLDDFGMLVIPGGFSYGDHLGAGAMLASMLRHRLLADIERFIAGGRPVLGICNGFQVLARLGVLGPIALAPNAGGRFECRWVRLEVQPSNCLFLRDIENLQLPVAHGEGCTVVPDGSLDAVLERAPLRYVDDPNGSTGHIAGVCNAAGNVFGLMPHPERAVSEWQHPVRRAPADLPALRIFQNATAHVRAL
jgi:phosphoribosylformylglycinamidine synthase